MGNIKIIRLYKEVENMNNQIPDIYYDQNSLNPCIASPNAPYAIYFKQTKNTLRDTDLFKRFVDNVVSLFRRSRVYTNYKSYLYQLGMNRCQVFGNITSDMATIEMHHNGLTIFDIAVIITNHLLNTVGEVTEFDACFHLRLLHISNEVPLVMVCKTAHQLEHNDEDFYLPVQMTFGNWQKLLTDYKYGLTYGIGRKLLKWINKSLQEQVDKGRLNESSIMLREKIKEWSEFNEYNFNNRTGGAVYNPYNNFLFGKRQFG